VLQSFLDSSKNLEGPILSKRAT